MAQPTTALIGVQLTVVQNQIFCSPIRNCVGYVSPVDATLEGNMENDASGMAEIVLASDGSFLNAYPFIRCTDASGAVVLFRTT